MPLSSSGGGLKSARDDGGLSGRRIARALLVANVAILAGIFFGQLTMTSFGADINEGLFDPLAGGLSAIPGMVRVSGTLTDIGKLTVNYGMALGVALFVGLARREWKTPAFILAAMAGCHAFQSFVTRIVDGSTPTGEHVVGTAGPYLSGGVLRVIVLGGLFAVIAGRSRRDAYRLAALLAVVEAVTRMGLGRHWPFDIFASIPLGFALLYAASELYDVLIASPGEPTEDSTISNNLKQLADH